MTLKNDMIHEDALPGHESALEPKPDWQPRYPGSAGWPAKSRSSPAPTAASAARSPRSLRAKAPISRSSICASMTMPPRHDRDRRGRGPQGDHDRRRRRRRRPSATTSSTRRLRRIRTDRHPRQQCRRTASRQGYPRHQRGSAAPHVPDQHLRDVLHGPGGAAASENGRGDRQLHRRDDVSGREGTARLLRHQGRDHRLHPLAFGKSGRQGHPRERRRAGTDLDAAQSRRRREPGKARRISARARRWAGPGQPNEVAPAFLFLACEDSSYMSGQVLHPNGGTIVNG